MAYGQIDPARLDGDALTRWYLRSPADIENERQAAAARRYADFFGEPGQPETEQDSTQFDQSSTDPADSHRSLRRVGYGEGLDDGVYRPGQDGTQKVATGATVWNCAGCHGLGPPVPVPVPLLPLFRKGSGDPPSDGASSSQPQWSNRKQCNQQFEADREICQRAKNYKCWENQNKRLAHCSPTGEVGTPPLGFGRR
jgi:hypothetical protein